MSKLSFKKVLFVVALVLLVGMSMLMVAHASLNIMLNPTSGPPGTIVSIMASGFTPLGDINAVLWNGNETYTFVADQNGNVNVSRVVPPVAPGDYSFVVTDQSTGSSTTTSFTVTSGSSSTSTVPTPTPTVPEFPATAIALVLLLLAGAVMLVARKH